MADACGSCSGSGGSRNGADKGGTQKIARTDFDSGDGDGMCCGISGGGGSMIMTHRRRWWCILTSGMANAGGR